MRRIILVSAYSDVVMRAVASAANPPAMYVSACTAHADTMCAVCCGCSSGVMVCIPFTKLNGDQTYAHDVTDESKCRVLIIRKGMY
jgi:hypothetical protein